MLKQISNAYVDQSSLSRKWEKYKQIFVLAFIHIKESESENRSVVSDPL